MPTIYLREAIASSLEYFGEVDAHALKAIMETWLQDIASLQKLIAADVQIKKTKNYVCIIYQGKQEVVEIVHSDKAIAMALDLFG